MSGMKHTAYGETKAPAAVDTLRSENCPVCGEHDAYDGDQCQVCGFVTPPAMFNDPDLGKAKMLDLRANPVTGDPNGVEHDLPPVDPDAVDENGEVVDEDLDGIPDEEEGPSDEEGLDGEGDVAPGAEGEEATSEDQDTDGDGQVDVEVRGHGDTVDPDGVDEDGEVPEEDEDDEPVDPEDLDEEGEVDAPDGQEETSENPDGDPGTPGDGVPDLLCPACGFESDAAQPTSTPDSPQDPADEGNGCLAGDACPNCGKATMMSYGEIEQMATGGAPV